LFLSEIGDFLGRVNEEKSVRWYLGFAPFAHGRLEEGDLLLSARAGRDFFNEVYDITPAREVSQLKLLVAKDEERFGRLLKRP